MKKFILSVSISFLYFQAFANVDVICDCNGPVFYAGQGQVASSGSDLKQAMELAEYQCLQGRGGQAIDRCDVRSTKLNPSILCQCKVGLFNKGQVTGNGPTLNEAFSEALSQCEKKGLSTQAVNGLLACRVF